MKADIQDRTARLAVRVIRLVGALPQNSAGWVLGKQVCRSGTSIGANVEEAGAAQTKAEFIRRMSIAKSEARETNYWLRLIRDSRLVLPERMTEIIAESEQVARILTTIVKTAEDNHRRR